MTHAGKTLAEIAGLDILQLKYVYFRRRDSYGRLIMLEPGEEPLPPWVEVDERGNRIVTRPMGFSKMFKRVMKRRGLSEEAATRRWDSYCERNPKLGRVGEKAK